MGKYKIFKDLVKDASISKGYKNIKVHLISDCKHNGQYPGHLVENRHLTYIPVDNIYSSVVPLRQLV